MGEWRRGGVEECGGVVVFGGGCTAACYWGMGSCRGAVTRWPAVPPCWKSWPALAPRWKSWPAVAPRVAMLDRGSERIGLIGGWWLAAAWGAALCAGAGAGLYASPQDDPRDLDRLGITYKPDPGRAAAYEARFRLFARVAETMAPLWPEIDALAGAGA